MVRNEVTDRRTQGRHRYDDQPLLIRPSRRGKLLRWDKKNLGSFARDGNRLLPDPSDISHLSLRIHRPGRRHGGTGREMQHTEPLEHPKRESQSSRGAADLARGDCYRPLELEHQAAYQGDPDDPLTRVHELLDRDDQSPWLSDRGLRPSDGQSDG